MPPPRGSGILLAFSFHAPPTLPSSPHRGAKKKRRRKEKERNPLPYTRKASEKGKKKKKTCLVCPTFSHNPGSVQKRPSSRRLHKSTCPPTLLLSAPSLNLSTFTHHQRFSHPAYSVGLASVPVLSIIFVLTLHVPICPLPQICVRDCPTILASKQPRSCRPPTQSLSPRKLLVRGSQVCSSTALANTLDPVFRL
ncbi:hypothetical protein HOY80DRAFT_711125 [Tuber brumale]|nr:hypothetical protein HOY80DRAFT_711125 [Tuber brumale]